MVTAGSAGRDPCPALRRTRWFAGGPSTSSVMVSRRGSRGHERGPRGQSADDATRQREAQRRPALAEQSLGRPGLAGPARVESRRKPQRKRQPKFDPGYDRPRHRCLARIGSLVSPSPKVGRKPGAFSTMQVGPLKLAADGAPCVVVFNSGSALGFESPRRSTARNSA
jgi:hypothetical protein